MKFILISDLHFVPPGSTLFGLLPQERFAPCVELINREHADADFILVAGDLAHHGKTAAYRDVGKALAGFDLPVRMMISNHGSRAVFQEVLPNAVMDANGFVQFMIEDEEHRLICLDTLSEGRRKANCARRGSTG